MSVNSLKFTRVAPPTVGAANSKAVGQNVITEYVSFKNMTFKACRNYFASQVQDIRYSNSVKRFFLALIAYMFGNNGLMKMECIFALSIEKGVIDFSKFPNGNSGIYRPLKSGESAIQLEARPVGNDSPDETSGKNINFEVNADGAISQQFEISDGFYNVAGGEGICSIIFIYKRTIYNVPLGGNGIIAETATDGSGVVQLAPLNSDRAALQCEIGKNKTWKINENQGNTHFENKTLLPSFEGRPKPEDCANFPNYESGGNFNYQPVELGTGNFAVEAKPMCNQNIREFIEANIGNDIIRNIETANTCQDLLMLSKFTDGYQNANSICINSEGKIRIKLFLPPEIRDFVMQKDIPLLQCSSFDAGAPKYVYVHGQTYYPTAYNDGKFDASGIFITNRETSIVDTRHRNKMRGSRDVNKIGNAYITGSPINSPETYLDPSDYRLFSPLFDTIAENEIGIIVDVANGCDMVYMQPYNTNPSGKKCFPHANKENVQLNCLDSNNFQDWQLRSYTDNGCSFALSDENKDLFPSMPTGLFDPQNCEIHKMNNALEDYYIHVTHKNKSLDYLKMNWVDGQSASLETLEQYCCKIRKIANGKKPLFHCNGGMGRSATFLCAYQLYDILQKAKEQKIAVTFDAIRQKSPEVNGCLNLAWVLRNLILTGRMARQAFIQSPEQLASLYKFAQHLVDPKATLPEQSSNFPQNHPQVIQSQPNPQQLKQFFSQTNTGIGAIHNLLPTNHQQLTQNPSLANSLQFNQIPPPPNSQQFNPSAQQSLKVHNHNLLPTNHQQLTQNPSLANSPQQFNPNNRPDENPKSVYLKT
ncbi:MAG: hypothetical protein LBI69_02500 [Puniceicoccales bacterium]|jgi:hypothetical protein|nr:hypothetical protein [Puniceicoccales bacterium]